MGGSTMSRVMLAALVVAAAALGASPAQAATTVVCHLQGTTTRLNPLPQVQGGSGWMDIDGPSSCSWDGAPPVAGYMTMHGTYSNISCMLTGSWTGTLYVNAGGRAAGAYYTVNFVGGAGVLRTTGGTVGGGNFNIRPADTNSITFGGVPADCVSKLAGIGAVAFQA